MTIAAADVALGTARATLGNLRDRIRAGIATEQERQELTNARATFANAKNQRREVLAAFFEDATEGLSSNLRTKLARMRINAARDVPAPFTVIDATPIQWHRLRRALANERVAERLDIEPDPAMQALLTQIRSNHEVANALASLNANYNAINTLWKYEIGL